MHLLAGAGIEREVPAVLGELVKAQADGRGVRLARKRHGVRAARRKAESGIGGELHLEAEIAFERAAGELAQPGIIVAGLDADVQGYAAIELGNDPGAGREAVETVELVGQNPALDGPA